MKIENKIGFKNHERNTKNRMRTQTNYQTLHGSGWLPGSLLGYSDMSTVSPMWAGGKNLILRTVDRETCIGRIAKLSLVIQSMKDGI